MEKAGTPCREEAVRTEIDRFAEDLENNEQLVQELADFAGTSDELAGWLHGKGYRIDAAELAAIISAKLDGLSDEELEGVSGGTGDMMSLKLQGLMDRRSKAIGTLSNVLKKISSAQDAIVDKIR